MYRMSTLQRDFSSSYICKPVVVSPTKFRQCCNRMWWNIQSKEDDIHYMTYFVRAKDISGRMKLPHVLLQNDRDQFEGEVPKEDMPLLDKSKIDECVDYIKNLLGSIDDGRITVSPYDTAWVGLIGDLQGRGIPQFPSCLDWISNNQFSDGSWGGEEHFFLAYDRLVNTLACVVALRYWNIDADKSEKGISFIKENISKLGDANGENMTVGFEIVFPALLQKAKELGIIGIPYDAPVIQDLLAVRDRKMARVPKELLHEVPTCLLHNLEGLGNVKSLGNLEWPKLLKLQTPKGSYLTSPAASAFAVIETKDEDCIAYINYIVNKFNGAPTTYPVEIFASLWAVDRLERLGISRFFGPEIKKCLDHVFRFWTEKGVFCCRECDFCDLDDTSMGFRLLRWHGYRITPNALENFKNGNNEFTCYVGQRFDSPSPIFNLYRASQVLFPGETILEEAREFCYNFLRETLKKDEILDKWLISKHLPNEIKCGLEMPWYASLPRLEARSYIDNYDVDVIWIGKSLFRMPEINNPVYLQLAKLDYIRCQAQHQKEWSHIQQWYEDYNLEEFEITKKDILLAYFLAAASIFEPERSRDRLAWVKSQILLDILSIYYSDKETDFSDQIIEQSKKSEDKQVRKRVDNHHHKIIPRLLTIVFKTLLQLTSDATKRIGNDSIDLLFDAWGGWLNKFDEVELLVGTINICSGHIDSKDILYHKEYNTLSNLTNKICHKLRQFENGNKKMMGMKYWEKKSKMYMEIETEMQLLVQLVLQEESSNGISKDVKETFLVVAKTFYYRAYFPTEQIENHISKVLFEQVVS